MVRKFIKTYLLILNIKCFQNPLQGTVIVQWGESRDESNHFEADEISRREG